MTDRQSCHGHPALRLDQALSSFRVRHAAIHAIRLDVTGRAAFAWGADETERAPGVGVSFQRQ
jgi:hypothetical protein